MLNTIVRRALLGGVTTLGCGTSNARGADGAVDSVLAATPVVEGRAETLAPPTLAANDGPKILYLEDDVVLLETMSDLLTEDGYLLEVVSTVLQARQQLATNQYDCVILDMELPDGTGLDAAQFAKTTRNRTTPLIAVSGYHDLLSKPGTEIFNSALRKPVGIDALHRAIEEALAA